MVRIERGLEENAMVLEQAHYRGLKKNKILQKCEKFQNRQGQITGLFSPGPYTSMPVVY
jgi:hypothetical protein